MSSPPPKDGSIAYPAVEAYKTERWGTYTLGSPSKPQDHPQNQLAASWEPIPGHILEREDHIRAFGQNPSSANTGYGGNPYISTTPAPSSTGKSPMDIITEYLAKWKLKFEEISKKAEEAAGNVWQHFKTGPNMADTAWGRLSQGTKLLTGGGFENVYKQTFDTLPDEMLRKTYACYLSTSCGPVAGTLYISTKKIAFCSDRPLSYQPAPGQTAWSYYKVVIPLTSLQGTNRSSNPNNPAEKYIQVSTVDNHEFWFMGFVNYEKAARNLQEAPAYAN